ncbi:MAG: glycosyltransferase family 2 protein [Kiritimatiellae bacterium]|nr:glycosyltransferase family 2 protein [Kiritimatiellia bacterium]NLG01288.1 glycosyltransferase family 2 protein [Lentisphaerota bacterium]
MVELSVVIPVYNSEGCLEALHRQLGEALRGIAHEVIYVDDQSTDASWPTLCRLCADDPSRVGLRLRKNVGQDNAILCGLRRARGAFVVVMDDDLQHAPSDIPALYAGCRERDLDVCYARFKVLKEAWWKRAGSWLNGKMAEHVIGKPKGLYLSAFKVMRREIAEAVGAYAGPFPYVDGLILSVTGQVGQLDVEHRPRHQGSSTYTPGRSLLLFLRVATGFSVWPLRVASCAGMVCAVCGFALAVFYLAEYALRQHRVEGWITLVVLHLIIGGMILFAIGVSGEYLGRLYLTCSGKPQSSVKEACGGKAP